MKRSSLAMSAAMALALGGGFALPAAATNYYSTGFEGPTFSPGPISGQDGWAVYSASSQPNLAQIESGVAKTGTQAAVVDGSAAGQTGPYYAVTIASPGMIDLSGDIMLTTPTGGSSWQFAAVGPALIQYAGGIDVTGNNIQAISGAFPIIGSLSYDVWHHVDILLNYPTQTFDVVLDGSTLASGLAFCGSNGACTGANVANFGVGIFDTFGNSSNLGYLDNFSIANPFIGVPEPGLWAMMLVGFGGMGVALRSRRKPAGATPA